MASFEFKSSAKSASDTGKVINWYPQAEDMIFCSEITIHPRHDRVLVKRLPEPERVGSIIVPDVARQKGIKGEIVAVGPECEVKPGQACYFNSRWNDDEQIPSEYHLIQEADIFAVIS